MGISVQGWNAPSDRDPHRVVEAHGAGASDRQPEPRGERAYYQAVGREPVPIGRTNGRVPQEGRTKCRG